MLQVSTLVKQMKKASEFLDFFGFYGWFDKMRTARTCDPKSVSPDRLIIAKIELRDAEKCYRRIVERIYERSEI